MPAKITRPMKRPRRWSSAPIRRTAPFQVGLSNRFQGLVDDLEMSVMGLNGAADYGEFIFERDNKYAAFFKPTNAADMTGDNVVNIVRR